MSEVKEHILIVDDNKFNVIFLEELLLMNQKDVSVAFDGPKAVEMSMSESFDLVLMDVMMPGMDGFEACRRIKELKGYENVPVIFVTALSEKDNIIKGFKAGGIDYITKPFNESEMLARINTHLALKAAQKIMAENNFKLQQEIEQRKAIEEKLKSKSAEVLKANTDLRKSYEQISIINRKLKENEEKFRLISETSIDPIIQMDSQGIVLYVSKAIENVLGYSPAEVQCCSIESLVMTEDVPILMQSLEKLSQTEGNLLFEVKAKNKSGATVYCEINLVKLNNPEGQRIMQGVIRNITERKLFEDKITRSIIETEEYEKTKFARELHDGLGASLSSISLYIDMVMNTELDQQEKTDIMLELKDLINQTVARAKSLSNSLRSNMLNNFGFYDAVVAFTQELMDLHSIKIDLHFPVERIRFSKNVETMLYRCLAEMLLNTIQHSGASKIRVELKIKDLTKVSLLYIDNGCGFDYDLVMAKNSEYAGLSRLMNRVNFVKGRYSFTTSPGNGFVAEILFNI